MKTKMYDIILTNINRVNWAKSFNVRSAKYIRLFKQIEDALDDGFINEKQSEELNCILSKKAFDEMENI